MKQIIAITALVFFVTTLIVLLQFEMTGNAVYEENPCKFVNCRVRMFGFWDMQAERIGTTPDGLAICHCPHEPPEILYFISTYRKY